jgi:hypothetical protein
MGKFVLSFLSSSTRARPVGSPSPGKSSSRKLAFCPLAGMAHRRMAQSQQKKIAPIANNNAVQSVPPHGGCTASFDCCEACSFWTATSMQFASRTSGPSRDSKVVGAAFRVSQRCQVMISRLTGNWLSLLPKPIPRFRSNRCLTPRFYSLFYGKYGLRNRVSSVVDLTRTNRVKDQP